MIKSVSSRWVGEGASNGVQCAREEKVLTDCVCVAGSAHGVLCPIESVRLQDRNVVEALTRTRILL
jgi:hypothetical protein